MNEAEAWSIERECWLSGADAYERWLSAEAMVVLPGRTGVLSRAAAIDALSQLTRWNDVAFESARLLRPAPDVVRLTYDAIAERDAGAKTYRALQLDLRRPRRRSMEAHMPSANAAVISSRTSGRCAPQRSRTAVRAILELDDETS